MRHRFFGSILVCLTLAASVAPAQESIDEQEFSSEQFELERQVLADLDMTMTELMQFGINIAGVVEPYDQRMEETKKQFPDLTSENCKEVLDGVFDHLVIPMFNDIRTEATSFFTEDQYTTLTTRFYQMFDLFEQNFSTTEDPEQSVIAEMTKLFVLPELVDLTEQQVDDLVQMQKEMFTESFGIHFLLDKQLRDEEKLLQEQLREADAETDQTAVINRLGKVHTEMRKITNEPYRKLYDKAKSKLDTLLTAEQKAKLAQIKADIPEYMRSALAGMKTGGTNDNAEEASGPWRPGANSWVPGMGAPTNLKNDNREAPRIREPRDGRRFPGSE